LLALLRAHQFLHVSKIRVKYPRPGMNFGFMQNPENYNQVFEWMNWELGDRKLNI
jgi:hypothetical protein